MDKFPSFIDSDMDTPKRQSIGVNAFDMHPSTDLKRLSSQGDSSIPSLFHYQPYTPNETTIDYAAINPFQGSDDHTVRSEVSHPHPPIHQGEGSSTASTRGQNLYQGQVPTGPVYPNPLHIGSIPVATIVPLNQQPPIETLSDQPNRTKHNPFLGRCNLKGTSPWGNLD